MNAGSEQSSVVVIAPCLDDEICHAAADNAGTVALCGADITLHPWCECPGDRCLKRQECVVCADLDRQGVERG